MTKVIQVEGSACSSATRFGGNGVARVETLGRLAIMITIWLQNRPISSSLARNRVFVFGSQISLVPKLQALFVTFFFIFVHFFVFPWPSCFSSDLWSLSHLRMRPLSWPGAWFESWLLPRHGVRMTLSIRPWNLVLAHYDFISCHRFKIHNCKV